MRKTVWIPAAAMADRPERALLELIIERGPWPAETASALTAVHGLNNAAETAKKALLHAKLPVFFSPAHTAGKIMPRPFLYTANPVSALSNAAGAALGIALGLLMYEGVLRNRALIACGGLHCSDKSERVVIESVDKMEEKLDLALSLGKQDQALAFVIPACTQAKNSARQNFMSQIQALAALNIYVLPGATLQEAVKACQRLSG